MSRAPARLGSGRGVSPSSDNAALQAANHIRGMPTQGVALGSDIAALQAAAEAPTCHGVETPSRYHRHFLVHERQGVSGAERIAEIRGLRRRPGGGGSGEVRGSGWASLRTPCAPPLPNSPSPAWSPNPTPTHWSPSA